MTRSASTPRLRLTHAYFAGLIVAGALIGPPQRPRLIDFGFLAASLLLVALACLGRVWCSAFVAGRKDMELVTDGPYAACRHPLYLLSLIGAIGLGLATRSLVLTAVTLIVSLALLSRAARDDEALLTTRHPQAFQTYANATPRWWPRGSQYRLPERLELMPRLYWKAFLDAGSFIGLYALILFAHALRTGGALPTLLAIP